MSNPELSSPAGFKQASLQELSNQLQRGDYPGYPETRYYGLGHGLDLPAGPWDINNEPLPGSLEQWAQWAIGQPADSLGRPLHPWLPEMLTNPNIGVVTGKGFYWQWGANQTADSVVLRHDLAEPHVLLIERSDTGDLALPGGFIEAGEEAEVAALREVEEETFLSLGSVALTGNLVYKGPVADVRTTAHAWAETTAFRFDLNTEITRLWPVGPCAGGDDAHIVNWLPLSAYPGQLFGSHSLLVELAVGR